MICLVCVLSRGLAIWWFGDFDCEGVGLLHDLLLRLELGVLIIAGLF